MSKKIACECICCRQTGAEDGFYLFLAEIITTHQFIKKSTSCKVTGTLFLAQCFPTEKKVGYSLLNACMI